MAVMTRREFIKNGAKWVAVASLPAVLHIDPRKVFAEAKTPMELADYLKLGRTKLYRMAQDGSIPASKLGNQWRFDRDEIDAWMKRQRPNKPGSGGE